VYEVHTIQDERKCTLTPWFVPTLLKGELRHSLTNDNNIVFQACVRRWLPAHCCYWLLLSFLFSFLSPIVYHLWWNKDAYTFSNNTNTNSGAGTNLKVGGGAHVWCFLSFPLLFWLRKYNSRFGERFRGDQYSLVSFLFAVLLLRVPRAQPFVKVGALPPCPTESAPPNSNHFPVILTPWSKHLCGFCGVLL